ncbi:hypothetical protein SprV_0301043200 [Sparganum proliferum]
MASLSAESSLEDLSVDNSWETELEIALLENADFAKVRSICGLRPVPARLRHDLWRLCLHVEITSALGGGMSSFTDVFDLPAQETLHALCAQAANTVLARLQRAAEAQTEEPVDVPLLPSVARLTSDFESVLTHFSKTYDLPFTEDSGWISVLSTLYGVLWPISRADLYAYFTAVFHRFVASCGAVGSARACNAFRLLLQYHEPRLCNFLDSHKLAPECYARLWFESLFANCLQEETLLALWDLQFLLNTPHFGMFVALVLLVNAKNDLMGIQDVEPEAEEEEDAEVNRADDALTAKTEDHSSADKQDAPPAEGPVTEPKSRDELLAQLRALPNPMQATDVIALVELTLVYARNTPSSFFNNYLPLVFGSPPELNNEDRRLLTDALSLLVSVEEILDAQAMRFASDSNDLSPAATSSGVRFLLVDCRPADQYNAGHLATAFYLDTELMLSNPPEFTTIVKALLQSQQRGIASGSKAAGEHIVFMGSGRAAEDRIANMVVAHFLRLGTPYVSLVDGGYAALHEALGPLEFNNRIVSHDPDLCFVCASNEGSRMAELARKSQQSGATPLAPPPPTNGHSEGRQQRPQSRPPPGNPMGVLSKLSTLLKKPATPTSTPTVAAKQVMTRTESPVISAVPAAVTAPALGPTKPTGSYRNTAAVFSIDDGDEEDEEEEGADLTFKPIVLNHPPLRTRGTPETKGKSSDVPVVAVNLEHCSPGEAVDFQACRQMPEVKKYFECRLLDASNQLSDNGLILLLERQFIVVQERRQVLADTLATLNHLVQGAFVKRLAAKTGSTPPTELKQDGRIVACIPFISMVRITSNKRVPELITFHFSPTDDLLSDSLEFVRVYIHKAGDAVKAIKLAVFNVDGEGSL